VNEYTITAAEVFLVVKTLKTGKAAGCDEIRHEIDKTLNRGVLCRKKMEIGVTDHS